MKQIALTPEDARNPIHLFGQSIFATSLHLRSFPRRGLSLRKGHIRQGWAVHPYSENASTPAPYGLVSLLECVVEHLAQHLFRLLPGLVVDGLSIAVQHDQVRNRALVISLHQLELRWRLGLVEVDDDEVHLVSIARGPRHRAPRLPLGVEAALALDHDVVWLARAHT